MKPVLRREVSVRTPDDAALLGVIRLFWMFCMTMLVWGYFEHRTPRLAPVHPTTTVECRRSSDPMLTNPASKAVFAERHVLRHRYACAVLRDPSRVRTRTPGPHVFPIQRSF